MAVSETVIKAQLWYALEQSLAINKLIKESNEY